LKRLRPACCSPPRQQRGKALGAALSGITLDDEINPFRAAQPAQRFVEPPHPERARGLGQLVGRNAGMNERDALLLCRLLRTRGLRPKKRSRRARRSQR